MSDSLRDQLARIGMTEEEFKALPFKERARLLQADAMANRIEEKEASRRLKQDRDEVRPDVWRKGFGKEPAEKPGQEPARTSPEPAPKPEWSVLAVFIEKLEAFRWSEQVKLMSNLVKGEQVLLVADNADVPITDLDTAIMTVDEAIFYCQAPNAETRALWWDMRKTGFIESILDIKNSPIACEKFQAHVVNSDIDSLKAREASAAAGVILNQHERLIEAAERDELPIPEEPLQLNRCARVCDPNKNVRWAKAQLSAVAGGRTTTSARGAADNGRQSLEFVDQWFKGYEEKVAQGAQA